MMRRLAAVLVSVSMLIIETTIAHAAEPQAELRRNPFERPALEELNANAVVPVTW